MKRFAEVVHAHGLPLRTSDGRPSLAGLVADAIRAGDCPGTPEGVAEYLGVNVDEVQTKPDTRKGAPAGAARPVKPVRQFLQDASQGNRPLADWQSALNS